MQNLTRTQQARFIEQLQAHRDKKKRGARANNRAANVDIHKTMSRVNSELAALGERTGAGSIVLSVRGHANDTAPPSWIATEGTENFLVESFGVTPNEVARRMDAWKCVQSKASGRDLRALSRSATKMISDQLRSITNRLEVGMSYSNYDREVRAELRVQLVGWPEGVKFATPSALGAKVRALHKALVNGECKWAKMTKAELEALNKELPPKAPRAPRSDKGEKRAKQARHGDVQVDSDDEPEDTGPDGSTHRSEGQGKSRAKRRRKEKAAPAFKSPETIQEEDGEEEEEE